LSAFTVEPPDAQLARSGALGRAVAAGESPPALRWYGYSAAAIVLGVGQPATAVDCGAARSQGMTVARRDSGGTAVLADETLLALDVALPAGHPLAGADVLEAYCWLGEVFRRVLVAMAPGQAARLVLVDVPTARADQAARRAASPGTADDLRGLACFGTLSPYEVAVRHPAGEAAGGPTMRKVVGLSQVRRRGLVLFQAGLYSRIDGARLAGVLALSPAERQALAGALRRRTAGLDDLGIPASALPELRDRVTAEAKALAT
jgi:lipoate-protein ligase A